MTNPDAARFEAIWQSSYAPVFGFVARRCHPDRAADLVEETFLAAWRRLDDCPPDPRPWLFGIARGILANDHRGLRRAEALRKRLQSFAVDTTAPLNEPSGGGTASDAFAALRPKEREAVALVAWDDLTTVEAARVAGCSEATFRVRLHRARKHLQAALGSGRTPPVTGEETT